MCSHHAQLKHMLITPVFRPSDWPQTQKYLHHTYGARDSDRLTNISDGISGWYVLVEQPLKIPLLSVPIAVDKVAGQGQRSNKCIFEKNKKMFFQPFYQMDVRNL